MPAEATTALGNARPTSPWPRGRVLLAVAGLTALLALLWADSLDEFFYKDDFALLRRARDGGLLELFTRRALAHFQGESEWGYWRPGWWALVELAHRAFGLEPLGYRVLAWLGHLGLVLGLAAVVARASGRVWVGALAGLILATMPAPVEAVAWLAAASNVLPAVLFVGLSGVCWQRHLEHGRARDRNLALLAFALGLCFREAAYHLPPLFLLGGLVVRGLPRRRAELVGLVGPTLLALALVLVHYARLDSHATPSLTPTEWLGRLGANLEACALLLVPLDGPAHLLGVALALALAWLFASGGPRIRYGVLWTLLSTLPYVASPGYASRFAYFPALVLAGTLALAIDERVRAGRLRGARWLGAGVVLFALAGALRFRSSLQPYLEFARVCRGILEDCRAEGVARFERLCVDRVPWDLANGLEDMLGLFLRPDLKTTVAALVERPPFVVHWLALPEAAPEQGFLTIDLETKRARLVERTAFLGGGVPVPLVAPLQAWQLVSGPDEALARIEAREVDLGRVVLLEEAPQPSPSAPPDGREARVLDIAMRPGRVRLELECPSPSVLLLSWTSSRPGRAEVDGEPARLLRANGIFQALALEAGRHEVLWLGRWELTDERGLGVRLGRRRAGVPR